MNKTQVQWNYQTTIQKENKVIPRHKMASQKRANEITRLDNSSSLSMANSMLKGYQGAENQFGTRSDEIQNLGMNYFVEKYLPRNGSHNDLDEEIKIVVSRKESELVSLRIYRDQLKLINLLSKGQSSKHSVESLKKKAHMQQKIIQTQWAVEKELKNLEKEVEFMSEYESFMLKCLDGKANKSSEILDLEHEEEVMANNLELETAHLMNELTEEQRRNTRDIRQVQDEIQDLRISIQQKEDHLRDLKARICTMYIKLHSRASTRNGSKSKDRNMSLSVKKFNNQNHLSIREAYIGNNAFKSYSRQVLEKVSGEEELVKIRFYLSEFDGQARGAKNREIFHFQCLYKSKDGVMHKQNTNLANLSTEAEDLREKGNETKKQCEEVLVKYLFSMKFFYKSKIVGVECRVKTERGNKHIQIGNCDPNIEHELLTLVNKKLITVGSFWHGKEMIGVSVWYGQKEKNVLKNSSSSRSIKKSQQNSTKDQEKSTRLQTFNEYYV